MVPQPRLLSTLTALSVLASAAPSSAQAPSAPNPEPAVEVVVPGTAPPGPRETTLSRARLEAGVYRSGSELMRAVPGMFITQHSGEGKAHQIFFRGFDAVHGQDLEVSVAGVPVNEVSHIHGQGYADLHFVIPELVERVRALPGAFDPTQGDFAIAGSLRYELAYPYDGVTTKLGAGSFGARRLFLAYHPADAPAQTFGAAEVYQSDGFGTARRAQRANATVQWQRSLSTTTTARLLASSYGGHFEAPGVVRARDVAAGLVGRLGSYDPDQGGTASRSQLSLDLEHLSRGTRFVATPFVVFRSLRLQTNYTGALANPDGGDNTSQANDATTVGFSSRLERAVRVFGDGDRLAVGVTGRRDDIRQGQRTTAATARSVDAGITATNVAGYLDLGLRPVERVLVHGAIRVDALQFMVDDDVAGVVREAQGSQLGPKATLDVLLSQEWVAFAGYGRGFRSPQARSLRDGERTPFTEVDGVELGTRFSREERLAMAVAGYATWLDNDLVFDETTSRNEAVPATQRLGVTIDFSARPIPSFASGCSGSYTRATFREPGAGYVAGETVPYVPVWITRCELNAQRGLTEFRGEPVVLSAGGAWSALLDRPLPFGERGDDVLLVDARLGVTRDNLELRLDVQNLLDRDWNDGEFVYPSAFEGVPASAIPERHVTAGAPRTWFASLALRL